MDENKEVSKKYEEFWEGAKKLNGEKIGEKIEYGKNFLKIRFESNNDLPLNKPIKLHLLIIIIRPVFS